MTYRTPPLPEHYHNPTPGICRWCNKAIGLTKTGRESKSTWHPECVIEYKMLFHPSYTRRAVWKRDNGSCKQCGTKCKRKGAPKWHMDHITPLIEASGDIKYWKMENLQTLCEKCHKEKTAKEAAGRAFKRRLSKDAL